MIRPGFKVETWASKCRPIDCPVEFGCGSYRGIATLSGCQTDIDNFLGYWVRLLSGMNDCEIVSELGSIY